MKAKHSSFFTAIVYQTKPYQTMPVRRIKPRQPILKMNVRQEPPFFISVIGSDDISNLEPSPMAQKGRNH
ncbi:MAG: hypothetical protein SOV72_02195, partial [Candidatus Enteromonas sp.]|nr:hypothetical protein [Candidatus Enteromonas sp.]